MKLRRFAFGMLAIVLAALACRQGQPMQEPKPAPNSPLPNVDKPEKDEQAAPGLKSPLSRDGG